MPVNEHRVPSAAVYAGDDGAARLRLPLRLLWALGGIARIVWDNSGQISVLGNDEILAAHTIYEASLQTELRGKGKGPSGARSIRWENFKAVDFGNVGGVVCVDWLKIGND